MTETPKPPEGFDSWLDVMANASPHMHYDMTWPQVKLARAELRATIAAQAERIRLLEAVVELTKGYKCCDAGRTWRTRTQEMLQALAALDAGKEAGKVNNAALDQAEAERDTLLLQAIVAERQRDLLAAAIVGLAPHVQPGYVPAAAHTIEQIQREGCLEP